MNCYQSTKEVKKLLQTEDNIIEQLTKLKKYSGKRGVQVFITNLVRANQVRDDYDSKYILYCIAKYFYELAVKTVKEPMPVLPFIPSNDFDMSYINSLLEGQDNIISQCKILKEYKYSKDVQNYLDTVEFYYDCDETMGGVSREFPKYCLNKYYYGKKVKKVEMPHIKLEAYVKPKKVPEEIYEPLPDLKVGDKIKIMSGVFKDYVCKIIAISEDYKYLTIAFSLYGNDASLEIKNNRNEIRKIGD